MQTQEAQTEAIIFNKRYMAIYTSLLATLSDPLDFSDAGYKKLQHLATKLTFDVSDLLDEE